MVEFTPVVFFIATWSTVPNYIDIKPYAVPVSGAPSACLLTTRLSRWEM